MDMDPMITKLLELWELDDSALSEHSLQASNALSFNKHLSIYSEKPAVPHHVHSLRDSCDDPSKISHEPAPETVLSESPTTESHVMLICEKCMHANQEHANWCVECGTAMLGANKIVQSQSTHSEVESDDLADMSVAVSTETSPPLIDGIDDEDSTSDLEFDSFHSPDSHRLSCTHVEQRQNDQDRSHQKVTDTSDSLVYDNLMNNTVPESPKRSDASPVVSKTHSSKQTKKFRIDKNTTSQLVTRKEYQRHWGTSSTYSWRKPSSIQKSTVCLSDDTYHDSLTQLGDLQYRSSSSIFPNSTNNRVPVLDLDAIDGQSLMSTSACTSIRSSPSIYETHVYIGHLLSLPDELILMVLSNLDQKDLTNCMLVCRRLFHIASDATLWKCIQIQKCTDVKDEQLIWMTKKYPTCIVLHNCKGVLNSSAIQQFFIAVANTLKVFSMSLCDFGLRSGDTIFINAALYCPKLHNIAFNWCNLSESAIIKGFHAFSRLDEVCIEQQNNGGFSNETLRVLIKKHGKTLRKLDVGSLDSSIAMSFCSHQKLPNLVAFAGTFMKVDEATFKTIAFVFPKLKELTFRYYIESTLSHEITKQLSNLQLESLTMKLSNSSALSQISCTHINKMATLRSLTVDCVDDEALQTLCNGKLRLRILDLSHSSITDKSFAIIGGSSFASTLTHVRMSKCHGIDTSCSKRVMDNLRQGQLYERTLQQVLMEFTLQCKRLRVVDLSWLYCIQDLKFNEFRHYENNDNCYLSVEEKFYMQK